ncbi:MAG: DUF411 domain-containing protein [Geminicoccales bacterium]
MIKQTLAVLFFGAFIGAASAGEINKTGTMFKNPQCGCCEEYAKYLRENGFKVTVKPTHNLSLIKREHGVPANFEGCHTMLIDNYVVEGHVPVRTLTKLLTEKPSIKGISLSGMPMGSPGMVGNKTGPFTIYEIGAGPEKVYARE